MTTTSITTSEAREHLYDLVKEVSKGLKTYEIRLRGEEPVILISKAELEAWEETLDILSSSDERKAISASRKEKKTVSRSDLLKSLGIK